jgi:hypothetical protein
MVFFFAVSFCQHQSWMEWVTGKENFLRWRCRTFVKFNGTQVKCIFYNGSQVKTSKSQGQAGSQFPGGASEERGERQVTARAQSSSRRACALTDSKPDWLKDKADKPKF